MRSSDRHLPRTPADTDVTILSLAEAMRALGLDHAASLLDGASQKAISRGETPTALLDHLIREQLRMTLEERARTAVRRSAIFPLTTMETYDFAFVEDKANVVFLGPSGVGKTHLANAIGHLACLRGKRVRFILAADLVNDLVAAAARNTLHKRLALWSAPELLLIDELGYLSFDARGADLLYQVFNRRYQRSSTIVTTNLPFKDWGKLFHNSAAASAIADRLVHKGLLVQITGKSRRSDREVEA
jgi:DNA replication protein DnaC